jgi:elongation factor 1-gamma
LKVYGKEPSPIEKPKEYVPEKKEAKKPAAAAPAAAPAKKEKKPAAKDDDDDDEPAAAAEPKAKHPCELLPKSDFVLDEWKRQYSNLDTPKALEWFWANHKPEDYSLWLVQYKYNDELSKVSVLSRVVSHFLIPLLTQMFSPSTASLHEQQLDRWLPHTS